MGDRETERIRAKKRQALFFNHPYFPSSSQQKVHRPAMIDPKSYSSALHGRNYSVTLEGSRPGTSQPNTWACLTMLCSEDFDAEEMRTEGLLIASAMVGKNSKEFHSREVFHKEC